MAEYQRTFLQECRVHERIISRQNIKELKISALRQIPVPSVKDTFVQESKVGDETFQRFSSKKSRLDRLRTLRDEKSFKKLPFERKNNSPSCLPLPLASKTNVVKFPPFPTAKTKNSVARTSLLVKNGSGSKSKNPSPGISRGIQQEINQTKTIKSKAHAENEYELKNISGVCLPIKRPEFPGDISCIHPVSEFSFAPDDFSFTVPESIQKLPYRQSFIPKIGWDAVSNLTRVSTPVTFKVQKENTASVRNKTHSKLSKPLANVINKIPGIVNLSSKKSPVLSETRILPKGKTIFQFNTAQNSSSRHSLAPKSKDQRKSPLQNGLENNKSTNNLKLSNKENTCSGSKVSPVHLLDKKAVLKMANPADGGFRVTHGSRASLLPSSHIYYGTNRLSMATKDFARLQCNNSFLKQPIKQQKSMNTKVKTKDKKLTKTSSCDSNKNQKKKLSSSVEAQKSYTKTLLKPSASLVNMNGKIEGCDVKGSTLESSKSLSNKSVSEPFKTLNDSFMNAVSIDRDCIDNAFGSCQTVKNGIESKKIEESSQNLLSNENSDANISLMRKDVENFIEEKDSDKITERKTITRKDVFRNSFSLMSTCFIDDEILDDAISEELAALDLSSSINMAGDTPLRNTKILSLIDSPYGKPLKSSLKFLREVRSPWRSAVTLESIKKNKDFLADATSAAENNCDARSVFNIKMVGDASKNDSSCEYDNQYHKDTTPLNSQDIQYESVGKDDIHTAASGRKTPTEKNTFEISFLGTPWKPSGIKNVPIRGDLITFSPIVNGVM